MCHDGRLLMGISGGRTLYTRQGAVRVGRTVGFRAPAGAFAPLGDPRITVRRRRPDDSPAIIRLHDAEPLRYEWTPDTFRILADAGEAHGTPTLVIERAGEGPVAYLYIRHGGPMAWWGEGVGAVLEYAGSRPAVLAALACAADLLGVKELKLTVRADEAEVIARLTAAGIPGKDDFLGGLFRVMDAQAMLKYLAPWFRERLGASMAGTIGVAEEDGQLAGLSVAGRVVPAACIGAFTQLLFGALPAEAVGSAAYTALAAALPVPLPDAGLNYA